MRVRVCSPLRAEPILKRPYSDSRLAAASPHFRAIPRLPTAVVTSERTCSKDMRCFGNGVWITPLVFVEAECLYDFSFFLFTLRDDAVVPSSNAGVLPLRDSRLPKIVVASGGEEPRAVQHAHPRYPYAAQVVPSVHHSGHAPSALSAHGSLV